jgi:thymidylate synthase ThyX
MKKELIKELKDLCHEDPTINSNDIKTLKDLSVEIIDSTKNPYRTMFEMATQTWGEPDKWSAASPELRFEIVKKVLDRKALPLALEAPYFAFQIKNISRAAFDQIARTRIGVVYAARGFKDNNLNYISMCIPDRLNREDKNKVIAHFNASKALYKNLQKNNPNWTARCIIPMYVSYNFIMVMHYATLQGFCANRMQTTEMPYTVATAWLMREAVKKEFPLLASYLRPACDWKKSDTTVQVNGFADELGVIHNSDYRQPGFDKSKYDVRYDEPCTDISVIEKELHIHIPAPEEWIDYRWDNLDSADVHLFQAK